MSIGNMKLVPHGRCGLVVVCSLLQFVFSVTYNAVILPETDVVLLEGSTLELVCRVRENHVCPTKGHLQGIYLYHQGARVSHAPAGSCEVHYTVHNVSLQHRGIYHCVAEDESTSARRRVALPKLVTVLDHQKPELKCVVNNMDSMNCRWCNDDDSAATSRQNYTLSWIARGENIYKNCTVMVGPCECHLCGHDGKHPEKCYIPPPGESQQYIPDVHYNFYLQRSGHGHTGPWQYDVIADQTIAIPAEVSDLRTTFVNSTNVQIVWDTPKYWLEYRKLTYFIGYTYEAEKKTMSVGENKKIHMVGKLRPYTTLNVSVWAKPENGLYDGLKAHLLLTSSEEAPDKSPVPVPGAYRPIGDDRLQIYWLPVPEAYRNGQMLGYNITTETHQGARVATYSVGAANHSLLIPYFLPVNITILGFNSQGASPSVTYSIDKTVMPKPVLEVAERQTNRSVLWFQWEMEEGVEVTNFTLLLCQNSQCQGEVRTAVTGGEKRNLTLNLSESSQFLPWLSISANTPTTSSGLLRHWTCIYDASSSEIPQVAFTTERESEGEMSVIFTQPDCSIVSRFGRPYSYIVNWTAVEQCDQSQPQCHGTSTIPSTSVRHTIGGLHNVGYKVTVSAEGQSRKSGPPTTMSVDAVPVPQKDTRGLIVMVIFLAVCILAIIVGVTLRVTNKYIKSNIPQPITPMAIQTEVSECYTDLREPGGDPDISGFRILLSHNALGQLPPLPAPNHVDDRQPDDDYLSDDSGLYELLSDQDQANKTDDMDKITKFKKVVEISDLIFPAVDDGGPEGTAAEGGEPEYYNKPLPRVQRFHSHKNVKSDKTTRGNPILIKEGENRTASYPQLKVSLPFVFTTGDMRKINSIPYAEQPLSDYSTTSLVDYNDHLVIRQGEEKSPSSSSPLRLYLPNFELNQVNKISKENLRQNPLVQNMEAQNTITDVQNYIPEKYNHLENDRLSASTGRYSKIDISMLSGMSSSSDGGYGPVESTLNLDKDDLSSSEGYKPMAATILLPLPDVHNTKTSENSDNSESCPDDALETMATTGRRLSVHSIENNAITDPLVAGFSTSPAGSSDGYAGAVRVRFDSGGSVTDGFYKRVTSKLSFSSDDSISADEPAVMAAALLRSESDSSPSDEGYRWPMLQLLPINTEVSSDVADDKGGQCGQWGNSSNSLDSSQFKPGHPGLPILLDTAIHVEDFSQNSQCGHLKDANVTVQNAPETQKDNIHFQIEPVVFNLELFSDD